MERKKLKEQTLACMSARISTAPRRPDDGHLSLEMVLQVGIAEFKRTQIQRARPVSPIRSKEWRDAVHSVEHDALLPVDAYAYCRSWQPGDQPIIRAT